MVNGWLAKQGWPMKLTVNGTEHDVKAEPDTPLLWVLRDELGLTGTKFGCGIAMCGACTVHVDGQPRRSCTLSLGDVSGEIRTIEALAEGEFKDEFEQLAKDLAANEKKIIDELNGVQCQPVDIGGYYQPDEAKTSAAMRPSETLNALLSGK